MQVLVLPVRGDRYALPLAVAREVAYRPRITRLPLAPPGLLGVVNVRGQVVPALDTGAVLGLLPLGEVAALVVADTARGPVALAVSALPATADLGEVLEPSERPGGIARHRLGEHGAATLLDLEALAGAERLGG